MENEKKLLDKIAVELIIAAKNVNDCMEAKDINRNHVNYGMALQCEKLLNFLGQETSIACWRDGDFLKIEKLTTGNKSVSFGGMENWLKDDEKVKDYICDIGGLYEGEGLEEAFEKWKRLPIYKKTESELSSICKNTGYIEIDRNEPPGWLPVV